MNNIEQLNKLFYDDKNYILGFNKFYEKLKLNNIDITQSDLLKYYNNQEISQQFKPKQRQIKLKIIGSNVLFEKMYCDTMYITDLNISILSFIDIHSKFVFVFPFKISKQLKSNVSALCLNKVNQFVIDHKYTIHEIVCDNGSEFLGRFKDACDDLHININYAFPGDKRKTSPIESFNRTLRSMIEKYRLVNRIDASNVFKIIKEIQNIYNNSYHSVIKDYPINVINGESTSSGNTKKKITDSNTSTKSLKLVKGDNVRMYIKDDYNAFNKLKPLWSKEIYTIENFKNGYYKLHNVDKLFTYSNLQKIEK